MRLAEYSVPKMNSAGDCGTTDGGELKFYPLAEAVRMFAGRIAGKILFVSDITSYRALAFAAANPRAIAVVLDGTDALPLFSMPDGVGGVFAAGGEQTILAARFFADVWRLPCAIAPSDGTLCGVYQSQGDICVGGEMLSAPLAQADIFCDMQLLQPSLGNACGRLALARLALFEARTLSLFEGERKGCEAAVMPSAEMNGEGIVRANAKLRIEEKNGAWAGEGAVLANLYGATELPAWRAFCELLAVYNAFFGKGKPRRYAVPDYAARATRAGVPYSEIHIPSQEEYVRRALVLERRRADCMRELKQISERKWAYFRNICAVSEVRPKEYDISETLRTLPERCPEGLTAIIRDFGLLEF